MREHFVNLTIANGDLVNQGFDDFALVLKRQLRPLERPMTARRHMLSDARRRAEKF